MIGFMNTSTLLMLIYLPEAFDGLILTLLMIVRNVYVATTIIATALRLMVKMKMPLSSI